MSMRPIGRVPCILSYEGVPVLELKLAGLSDRRRQNVSCQLMAGKEKASLDVLFCVPIENKGRILPVRDTDLTQRTSGLAALLKAATAVAKRSLSNMCRLSVSPMKPHSCRVTSERLI